MSAIVALAWKQKSGRFWLDENSAQRHNRLTLKDRNLVNEHQNTSDSSYTAIDKRSRESISRISSAGLETTSDKSALHPYRSHIRGHDY